MFSCWYYFVYLSKIRGWAGIFCHSFKKRSMRKETNTSDSTALVENGLVGSSPSQGGTGSMDRKTHPGQRERLQQNTSSLPDFAWIPDSTFRISPFVQEIGRQDPKKVINCTFARSYTHPWKRMHILFHCATTLIPECSALKLELGNQGMDSSRQLSFISVGSSEHMKRIFLKCLVLNAQFSEPTRMS